MEGPCPVFDSSGVVVGVDMGPDVAPERGIQTPTQCTNLAVEHGGDGASAFEPLRMRVRDAHTGLIGRRCMFGVRAVDAVPVPD